MIRTLLQNIIITKQSYHFLISTLFSISVLQLWRGGHVPLLLEHVILLHQMPAGALARRPQTYLSPEEMSWPRPLFRLPEATLLELLNSYHLARGFFICSQRLNTFNREANAIRAASTRLKTVLRLDFDITLNLSFAFNPLICCTTANSLACIQTSWNVKY